MKNFILSALAALFIIAGCSKDGVQSGQALENLPVNSRSGQITICHKTGNGQFNPITINQNALAAHLAHGDYLPDADGDGYTAIGACTGSMDDCDDNNADVNPGAEEVCGNGIDDNCDGNIDEDCCNYPCFNEETLNGGSNFYYYVDTEIEDCYGWNNLGYVYGPEFIAYAYAPFPSYQVVYFYSYVDGSYCSFIVGEGEGYISQADFDCTMALLRAFIAAHPEIPSYCDLYGLQSGNGSDAMVRPENQLKLLMPENIRKQLDKQ